MISEGSSDTENYDAKTILYFIFTWKTLILYYNNIPQFHYIFGQINAALVSITHFFQKK